MSKNRSISRLLGLALGANLAMAPLGCATGEATGDITGGLAPKRAENSSIGNEASPGADEGAEADDVADVTVKSETKVAQKPTSRADKRSAPAAEATAGNMYGDGAAEKSVAADSSYGSGTGGLGIGAAKGRPAPKKSKAMRRAAPSSPRPTSMAQSYRPPIEEREPAPRNERFQDHGINPMVSTAKDHLSTFAVDVDTGSYTVARRTMEQGQRPYANAVRVEEWVNYFNYGYEAPSKGAFDVHLDAAPSPLHNDRQVLRIGVRGKDVAKSARKPIHATFLVDVSGSMRSRLSEVQHAMNLLVGELDKRDSVAIVTYAGNTGVVLKKTRVTDRNRGKITGAIQNLVSGGGTNMDSGMKLAYHEASKNLIPGHVSRVIVLSDGDANIGRSSHQAITKSIQGYTLEGVTLSTVGFGRGNYRDHMMEQLANAGNGNYSYIDSPETARRVFVDKMVGTMQVIAKDVKIQVDFDKNVVESYRLIGYENRDIADKDFRNDTVDAGEIGAGHTVTALYEVKLKSGDNIESGTVATVRIRQKTPRGYKAKEQAFTLTAQDIQKGFDGLTNDARFAVAVATAAEIFRGSPHVSNVSLDDVAQWALQSAQGPHRDERLEFVSLVERVKRQNVVRGPGGRYR